MSTLKDVARQAGVSIATVSHVLNNSKAVSPGVRRRVLAAVKAVDYRRNRVARSLRTGQSYTLGLIVPDLTNPFFPELAQAVENRARALGYALLLIDASSNPQTELAGLQLLAEHGVDGVIWIPISDQLPDDLPFPVVVVDRPLANVDGVYADHHQGGVLLAQYAHKLGHRRVGLLLGPQSLASARLRREGFWQAANGKLEIVWEQEVPFSLHLPTPALELFSSQAVSLIVSASDVVAIAALRALDEAGISVPEEVSLLGFDDIPWASLVRPALSTVRQPLATMGERAVAKLLERIQNPEQVISQEVFEVELVERHSAHSLKRSRS